MNVAALYSAAVTRSSHPQIASMSRTPYPFTAARQSLLLRCVGLIPRERFNVPVAQSTASAAGNVAMSMMVQRVVFNLPTSLAITVFTPTLAGLLLLSWLQHRTIFALALWGSGFLVAAVATTLIIIARGTIPDFWSIVVGNALIALAYGILWSGVRNFEGKPLSVVQTMAGAIVCLATCLIGPIYAAPTARATVLAAIAISYTLLSLLETVFVCICAAYLFGGLAKDRIAALYRRASLIDPLTGIANRRNFSQTAERMIARARFAGQPIALLMFDLDRFKSINDTHGHQAGDAVLTEFCRLAISLLRPTDLFGRVGGEEFAGLLPDTGQQDAILLAERLRSALEATCHTVGAQTFAATVSVGVAISDDASSDLDALLEAADQALYRAKVLGRNRVELSLNFAKVSPQKQRPILSSGVR